MEPRTELLEGLSVIPYAGMTYPALRGALQAASTGPEARVLALGTRLGDVPAGLALARCLRGTEDGPPGPAEAQLLSIFTIPEHRRQGIARRLVTDLEQELVQRGRTELFAVHERSRPSSEKVEGLLDRCGFPAPTFRALVCRCHGDALRYFPWFERARLPAVFSTFLWSELTEKEREEVQGHEGKPGWHPSKLSPFTEPRIFEPLNSLGLRLRGEVVGWQVNHRISPSTIRYTTMFVREDLQALGVAIPLQMQSMRLHVESGIEGLDQATFMVYPETPRMLEFVRQHMGPYLAEQNDSMESRKQLG